MILRDLAIFSSETVEYLGNAGSGHINNSSFSNASIWIDSGIIIPDDYSLLVMIGFFSGRGSSENKHFIIPKDTIDGITASTPGASYNSGRIITRTFSNVAFRIGVLSAGFDLVLGRDIQTIGLGASHSSGWNNSLNFRCFSTKY